MTLPNQVPIAAIVLAGGQSRRMGQDKALISIHGVPLLRQVCDTAMACTAVVYVVTPRGAIYQSILPANCQIIPEPDGPVPPGPLVGFARGLAQVSAQWVLLLACDLPRLQPQVLSDWAEKLQIEKSDQIKGSEATLALLPRSSKGWEPLCGFYRRDCLPSLQNFIQQGGRSFQSWLAQIAVRELPFPKEMMFNCNTPHDLAALPQDMRLNQ